MSQFKVDNSQKENKSQTRILMVFFLFCFLLFCCFIVLLATQLLEL